MHNNYIKELAIKSYQEEIQKSITELSSRLGTYRVLCWELCPHSLFSAGYSDRRSLASTEWKL